MQDRTPVPLPCSTKGLSPWDLAWQDLVEAVHQYWFWLALGWKDIVHRYRGSILGPFWLTITTGIFIAGLGPLYATLFNLEINRYLPEMAMGILVWNLITGTIHDCCRAYIDSGTLMRQIKLPRLTPIFHVMWRNVIIFMHNLPIIIAVLLYAKISPTYEALWIIPGLILLFLNLFWIGVILSIICLRYRDVLQIVSSILTLGFFFTPVMWSAKTQPVKAWIVNINPFAALIELVRAPLLGEAFSTPLIHLALVMAVLGLTVATLVFVTYRKQIIYWV